MNYDHDECRDTLFRSLTAALADRADVVRSLESAHRTESRSGLRAVSYDVLPWQPFVAISFRTAADGDDPEARLRPAGWGGYELIGEHNASGCLAPALKYVTSAYEAVSDDPGQCQEINHLIQLAAADALLDPKVAELLQACNVPASVITDQIPYREFADFEYIVVDEDRVFEGNYCDILWALRVARRLLGRQL